MGRPSHPLAPHRLPSAKTCNWPRPRFPTTLAVSSSTGQSRARSPAEPPSEPAEARSTDRSSSTAGSRQRSAGPVASCGAPTVAASRTELPADRAQRRLGADTDGDDGRSDDEEPDTSLSRWLPDAPAAGGPNWLAAI